MSLRLTTEFWVSAYLKRLQLANIPVFITSKGDKTAGAVLIKINTLDGKAKLFQRSYDLDGNRVWVILIEGSDAEIEAVCVKQQHFDPDVWIVELEDKLGRHLLDEEGLN